MHFFVSETKMYIELYVIIFCLLLILIAFVTLIGNIAVLIVYYSDKTLKSINNYFFANLCITDIAIVLCCLPIAILDLINYGQWQLGPLMCNLFLLYTYFYYQKLRLDSEYSTKMTQFRFRVT